MKEKQGKENGEERRRGEWRRRVEVDERQGERKMKRLTAETLLGPGPKSAWVSKMNEMDSQAQGLFRQETNVLFSQSDFKSNKKKS